MQTDKNGDKLADIIPIHIGQLIRSELAAQQHTVTWLAARIPCARRNVYDLFERSSVDTALLMRLSKILHRNFFMLYADLFDDIDNMGGVIR